MSSIPVKNVFNKSFSTVKENDSVSKCLQLFKKEMPPVVAVLNDKGKYAGVISRRWIIRSRHDPATTKVKTLMRPAPKVSLNFSLSRAANLMIEGGVRQLPVFEGNKLMGFVTDENLIHGSVTQEWGNTPVEKIMTKAPQVIDANRSVGAVLSLFREHGVSHVPVVDKGKLAGIISIQDVIEKIFQPRQRQTLGEIVGEKVPVLSLPAKGIMTRPVITVTPETILREAAAKMHEQEVSCLVVLLKERLVGIVTKLDFLEPISQLEKVERKISIQFGVKGVALNPDQQGFMMDEFEAFAHKYEDALELGTLFVYMKTHGTNHKGVPLLHCRMQLRTVKGSFFSSSEGFGVESTFRVALDRLDKRLLRSRELSYNPKYARDFLRKVGMPQEEL
ncbi:MAG: CBS domain-containing protein [Candidatus Bathyarchaeia archaeon]|nr:CBS domain-containing protein [Candidatus Bathyarchaeia archaeon]